MFLLHTEACTCSTDDCNSKYKWEEWALKKAKEEESEPAESAGEFA